ncbi:MAG: cysteine desulfurase family protein [Gudongella sp.]|nr:cysteine desulfurase family protein [Gudongella sp.]
MIYLDNCATTKPRIEVINEMALAMENNFGNPSSLHRLGLYAENALKEARISVANFLGVSEREILFTSGGTESNNLAIQGALKARRGNHIITTKIEHPSVINTIKNYESKGYSISYLENDDQGRICLESLKNVLTKDTALVSIIHVNNEIGTIQDLEAISKIILESGTTPFFHVDGVQSFGKISFSLKKCNIDSYSFSAHKIHGPKGVGGLYLNKDSRIAPLFYGGNQENGLRSGTENLPSIMGLKKAVDIISISGEYERNSINELRNYLIKLVTENINDIKVNSPIDKTGSPYILNISFKDIKGEVLLHYLEEKAIYVSTASACSSKGKNKSHVLKAINLDEGLMDATIRICFSYENTLEQMEIFVKVLKESVTDIRSIIMRR